ncbi:LTA synthase family protein [Clostridium botulinum]|uniref:Sulfatase family protein n=1 Tax=Clostridium botulinum (strain Eklund 17B / Type B) TaxID=935198 RepID=B2TR19_CLOBB|nr:sulfatase family protein [Clostridium botulinum B str. Eklund 17B (NRP)]MBY6975762.1 LTA synthase family protein [Clostridium botulinum]MBY7001311.1 LTA synthase family protein [Clostridium botulinum]MCR1274077.1 LTA synthase family protein [Clostridium botulinum]NFD69159.1 LTA synthase family protein [Clostridium botulinum]
MKKLTNRKLFSDKVSILKFFTVITMLIKSIIFIAILNIDTTDKILKKNISFKFTIIYLAFILFVYSFGYLFSKNRQTTFYIILNSLYTLLLIADLSYFRANRDLLGLKNILFENTFNPLQNSLMNLRPVDLIFIIDIILLLSWVIKGKIQNNNKRSLKKFFSTIIISVFMIIGSCICVDALQLGEFGDSIIFNQWTTLMEVKAPGPIGYHVVEGARSINKYFNDKPSSEDKKEIENWLTFNKEKIEDNEYKGLLKGKNVIFLQIESLENFVINQKTNGKEITPFLNKLASEGLYFNNFYEQNNAGNSIDCDFMINTSIYPLGNKITALNYGENVYPNSLPRILQKDGYFTISSHAELPNEFNWTELHKNSFGANELWTINDYVYEESVGYGLSDKSFLSQTADKLKDIKQPFFIQLPTLSNHGPFDLDEKYRQLNLPDEVNDSYLGGYFESVLYTDNQLEMFYNKLNESGLLDDTVLVIYGDHTGVHKYYNEDIQDIDYENNWWDEVDHKIPLIIYSKNMEHKIVNKTGGQIDILPTICYLLGIDDDSYRNSTMGRILVNTNRNAITIKGNHIMGNVKPSDEEHVSKAYEIGEKIIKTNYFNHK